MARPTTKEELLNLSLENYNKLLDYINALSEDEQKREFPEGTLNRTISDVIFHLHEWHLLMLNWYEIGMKGERPPMPAAGYTWKTLPDFNRKIWEKYKDETLEDAKSNFDKSFKQVQNLISSHSNDELFEKKRYKWTGTTSLGAYLVSCTSSHYDWALKLIKKAQRRKVK